MHRCKKILKKIDKKINNIKSYGENYTPTANSSSSSNTSSNASQSSPLHPQLLENTNLVFSTLDSNCRTMVEFIANIFIKKTEDQITKTTRFLNEKQNSVTRSIQQMMNLNSHVLLLAKKVPECSNVYNALESGFTNHCKYLGYFLDLNKCETKLIQLLSQINKNIKANRIFLDDQQSKCNHLFHERFLKGYSFLSLGEMKSSNSGQLSNTSQTQSQSDFSQLMQLGQHPQAADQPQNQNPDSHLNSTSSPPLANQSSLPKNNENNPLNVKFQNFEKSIRQCVATLREPHFNQLHLYSFTNVNPATAPLKLRVKRKHEASLEGEVSLEQDEVVDLVDGQCMEYWVVKKANGVQGYAPALLLSQYIGSERPRSKTTIE
ncbi:hypothetical protein TRFO_24225 [Tritrichomonas foetus]|uniref:SH3 domain-containing protein n=1 Tax=Tritrichomonas foetus TaxID=1144522 RepID=A0A1J4K8F5_9EUKA|nr:hypothetical protein TRFO_24225 [Tritrichomonas foetus]|eukprot:OHT07491.1 hypothetical protein TRFO_24225 [Tritrichomonas foetus]